ncbi:MAG TPA: hypothetical protein VG757_06175 [Devosia sp.]|nr:hypothetical protein [Devosia sp.]
MKIRSLLLGTVAAAGLSTGAFATDLGVETGLDVCDDLGLTGLTISSDTNCLQISGSVHFEYTWGDYAPGYEIMSYFDVDTSNYSVDDSDGTNDSSVSFDSWLKFVATADSSFGPASATIKWDLDASTISQLYVSIGEGTVFTAGRADSIFKDGEDEPKNFLGLFNSEVVDAGVIDVDQSSVVTGGNVLQVVSSMDNFWIGGGLENLGSTPAVSSVVGVVAYNTDDIKAHASFAADGILAGGIADWVFHSGFEGTFDMVSIVGAYGTNSDGMSNALGSVSATFDNFTIAGSGEWFQDTNATEWGVGASIASEVSDGVTVKLGWRHYENDDNAPFDTLDQVAAQVVAAVSDEVTLTGEVGAIANGANSLNGPTSVFYGSGKVEWNPGGDFKASVKGEANSWGAYKITTTAEKSF